MKSKSCLLLICFFMPNIQFGMENNNESIGYSCDFGMLTQKHKFEDACNTIRKAVEENNLSLFLNPIKYFSEIQKDKVLLAELCDIMAQHPSPLLPIVEKIQYYTYCMKEITKPSKHELVFYDNEQYRKYSKLRDIYYEGLRSLCSTAPFLCLPKWNSANNTPLLCAVSSEFPMEKEIRLLLHYNADPYEHVSNPKRYKSPLEAAAALGYASIVDLLIKYNNKSKEKTVEDPITRVSFSLPSWSKKKLTQEHKKLREAVEFNDFERFKKIVDKPGIDTNYQYHDERHGYRSLLAILLDNYFVCRQLFFVTMNQYNQELAKVQEKVDGQYDIAQDVLFYFLDKKPECNVPYIYNASNEIIHNAKYQTPLKEAIRNSSRPLIVKLIEAGANPFYKDNDEDITALAYAYNQNTELGSFINKLLYEKGKQSSLVESE